MHITGTQPYPWPYDGRLSGSNVALVLAGWDTIWAERSLGTESAHEACGQLARAVSTLGGLVLGVSHRGAPALPTPDPALAVTADGLDGFFGGPLDGMLRRAGRTHLLVAGLGLEGPVHSTLRSANDRGYECLLISDAIAPLTTTLADASAKTVTMSGGIFGAVGTVADTLTALCDSSHRPPAKET